MLKTDQMLLLPKNSHTLIISNSTQTVSNNHSEWWSHETQLLHIISKSTRHTRNAQQFVVADRLVPIYTRVLRYFNSEAWNMNGPYRWTIVPEDHIKCKCNRLNQIWQWDRYHAHAINLLIMGFRLSAAGTRRRSSIRPCCCQRRTTSISSFRVVLGYMASSLHQNVAFR
jgi:hypothetical protein